MRPLIDCETHFLTEGKNSQSTVASDFAALRALVNRAIDESLLKLEENPFTRFTIKQGEAPEREKLTVGPAIRVLTGPVQKGESCSE